MTTPQDGSERERPDGVKRRGPESWGRDPDPDDDSDDSWRLFARDLAVSIVAVVLLGAYLFAISGVWPPMVAIESGSMEPNMEINDLAFVMDTDRFQPSESTETAAGDSTGVVTAAVGSDTGYTQFGEHGDVIVFRPDGNERQTPIIHRAMFWVEAGENWCEHEAANASYLGDTTGDQCIAPHSGFITKGDDNPHYDQANNQITSPVKPEWIVGTAELRIPYLGWFRLQT